MNTEEKKLLQISQLSVSFVQYDRGLHQIELPVITDLNVSVGAGEIVAVVGSSGSGKSLLAHAVLGLLPSNANVTGNIFFQGELLTPKQIEKIRGKQIALVPQSVNYLDPLMKVGAQVRNGKNNEKNIRMQKKLFQHYDLQDKTEQLYPFELSGGMARRVLLSASQMESPSLIIADEPTPGLHLEMAKKAMKDFRDFANEGNGVLLITHDIELALEVADRITVFYAGTTVEEAKVSDFTKRETLRHPYTRALWDAMPRNGFRERSGQQPYVKDMPKGCPFGPRCEFFTETCTGPIPVRHIRGGTVRCILGEERDQT